MIETVTRTVEPARLLTAAELAEKLSVSLCTIYYWTREKAIPFRLIGKRTYRYVLDDVLATLPGESKT